MVLRVVFIHIHCARSHETCPHIAQIRACLVADARGAKRDERVAGMSRSKEGFFLRCLKPLDDHVSVKLLLRVWGPRVEFVVRLILVATFLDDSVRTVRHFSAHTEQVGVEGYLKPLAETSPELVRAIAMVALGVGLLAQSIGSLCLLALFKPDGATMALMGWAIAQPVLYAQLANIEFVAESLSLVGGLLILRAHLSEQAKREYRRVPSGGGELNGTEEAASASEASIARTQLLGRLLLLAVYLYHALLLFGRLLPDLFESLSRLVIDSVVLAGLVAGCALVAAGLRSRTVALTLALVNLGYVCYRHPFFRSVWPALAPASTYDAAAIQRSMPHVALPKDVSANDLEAWLIFDLHRYYFFQGLSTSGALLLLAQFGPGEMAVEEDEILLADVQRARD